MLRIGRSLRPAAALLLPRVLARVLTLALVVACLVGPTATADDEPSDEALVAAIPFEDGWHPSRVVIDLSTEGSAPFVMMLDTGASGSVLTPGAARALGVSVRRTKSSPYRKATRLGRDLQFWVDDRSSDTGSKTGWDYGLLGGEFLDDYVLEIDYPNRFVRFYDPRKYSVPETATTPGARVLPFRRSGTRILAEVEIEGTTALTLLDTGAPAVLLAGREAKKAGIDWKGLPRLEGVGGVLGPIRTYTYEARRLRFAGFEFDGQPIAIAPRGAYNQGGPTDSALGYDLLGHFVVRIDYRKKRLWLRRGPEKSLSYWGAREAPPPVATPPPPGPEEVEADDARRRAEWEAGKDERYYAETTNGFVVVDGYRLREGPKEGEVWYTHEEMLERRKELREAKSAGD